MDLSVSLIADATWLETSGVVLLAIGLVLSCVLLWLTNLIGLPGNWFCVLLVALYAWLGPNSGRIAADTVTVLILFALAMIGELIEFVAGAAGATKAGASRKSTVYSIIGSILGALAGAVMGIPIPVVGSLVAAVLFGGIGAAAGAMYGEWTTGRQWKENLQIGKATFVGRTFGTLGKFAVGLVMLVLVLATVLI